MSSLGHPWWATRSTARRASCGPQSNKRRSAGMPATLALGRNFLHSAALELTHPRTKELLKFSSPLPAELETLLESLENDRQEGPRQEPGQ